METSDNKIGLMSDLEKYERVEQHEIYEQEVRKTHMINSSHHLSDLTGDDEETKQLIDFLNAERKLNDLEFMNKEVSSSSFIAEDTLKEVSSSSFFSENILEDESNNVNTSGTKNKSHLISSVKISDTIDSFDFDTFKTEKEFSSEIKKIVDSSLSHEEKKNENCYSETNSGSSSSHVEKTLTHTIFDSKDSGEEYKDDSTINKFKIDDNFKSSTVVSDEFLTDEDTSRITNNSNQFNLFPIDEISSDSGGNTPLITRNILTEVHKIIEDVEESSPGLENNLVHEISVSTSFGNGKFNLKNEEFIVDPIINDQIVTSSSTSTLNFPAESIKSSKLDTALPSETNFEHDPISDSSVEEMVAVTPAEFLAAPNRRQGLISSSENSSIIHSKQFANFEENVPVQQKKDNLESHDLISNCSSEITEQKLLFTKNDTIKENISYKTKKDILEKTNDVICDLSSKSTVKEEEFVLLPNKCKILKETIVREFMDILNEEKLKYTSPDEVLEIMKRKELQKPISSSEKSSIIHSKQFANYILDVWFNPKRLSPEVEAFIYWRDPKLSGLIFASGLILLLSLAHFSFISVIANTGFGILICAIVFRIYKDVLQAVQKTPQSHPYSVFLNKDISLPKEKIHEFVDVIIVHVNECISELRRLFLVEDMIDSLRFALVLWALTYLGSWFNGLTLIIIGFVSLFTLPKVYENNKTQIDQYLQMVHVKFGEIVSKIKESLPAPLRRKTPESKSE